MSIVRGFLLLAVSSFFSACLFAQSTGAIQGSVFDATGAAIPSATVTLHSDANGTDRVLTTDAAGAYSVPSLPVGAYRSQVKAPGMAQLSVSNIIVSVGTATQEDFTLKLATASQIVEIMAAAPVVDTTTVSVGTVVNQKTVQEIPLNGRHFVDLALLTVGTVTPPANGFLTAPLRGQGSFSFNSAGAREDSVNFMIIPHLGRSTGVIPARL